jgi:hypothetical protein
MNEKLNVAIQGVLQACNEYVVAVDLLPLPGPQARTVNRESAVFGNLHQSLMQLQQSAQQETVEKKPDLCEGDSPKGPEV